MRTANESLGTVARVIALLRLMAESDNDLTLTALSDKLGLAPSTIHRLLSLLAKEGLVGRNAATKTYYCDVEFVRISSLVLGSSRITNLAEPILQSLAKEFNESSMLCLYFEQQQRYAISKVVHGTHLLRYDIQENTPLALVWGASARSILAFLPQAEIDDILSNAGPSQVDGHLVDDTTRVDLVRTRERGYAFTLGQRVDGSIGFGAPFFEASGKVLGSICLTIPQGRFDPNMEQTLGRALIHNAAKLSRSLGYISDK